MLLLRSEAEMLDRNAVSILSMIHILEAEILELDKGILESVTENLIVQILKRSRQVSTPQMDSC